MGGPMLLLLLPAVAALGVEVAPLEKQPMGAVFPVQVRLVGLESHLLEEGGDITVRANLTDSRSWAVRLLNSSVTFTNRDMRGNLVRPLWLQGDVIGFNNLTLSVGGETKHTETIFIVMSNPMMNQLCTLVLVIMVLLNSINMGAQLEIDIIVEVFKKPIGPMVGFVSQFLFMPLFSFLVGWIITDDYLFRLGLFVLGCCPGGTGSNFWTLLLKGDINLSITMTFLSTVAALGMMPLWIYLMGPLLTEGRLVIPFQQLIISLMGLILPTLLGMWVRWRWPRVARLMEKVIVPFTLLTVFFILTVGVWINLFIFLLITPLMVLAGFAVAFAGYALGALLAWAFRLKMPQITAVAIETSFQNGSIAFILLKLSLEEPMGELAAVAPVAQLLITGIPLWIFFASLKIYQRWCGKATEETEEVKDPITLERLNGCKETEKV